MTIEIKHGIYDIAANTQCNIVGYWSEETRSFMPVCIKFKHLLVRKGKKFFEKYGIDFIHFTLGVDEDKHINVITICNSHFDEFDYKLGENITVGRIRRMRGDLQKTIYEYEEFEKKIKLYDKKYDGFNKVKTIYKIIKCKRAKLDKDGKVIVNRKVYFVPYDLDRRYPDIEHSDGTTTIGEIMYPYIYVYD